MQFICNRVGRHISRRNLRFCSDRVESGKFKSSSGKSSNVTSYGCVMHLRNAIYSITVGSIHTQRGAGVARFDERVYQNLTRWNEQQLRLHVFLLYSLYSLISIRLIRSFTGQQNPNVMEQFTYLPKQELDLDDKLTNLYRSKYANLLSRLSKITQSGTAIDAALPLLLWLDDEHKNVSDKLYRIMIFGRETNNWNSPDIPTYDFKISSSDDIANQVNAIQDIYNAYCYFDDSPKSRFTKNGPKLFEKTFRNILQKEENACFIWNNICKIGRGNAGTGRACGIAPYKIHEAEMELFNVVPDEIDIIRPNILVFLTGSKGVGFIKKKFPDAEFIEIEGNLDVEKVILPKQDSVKYAYRVKIHPSARISALSERLTKAYSFIIEDFRDKI